MRGFKYDQSVCSAVGVFLFCSLIFSRSFGQPIGVPVSPLGDGPWVIETAEQPKIKVSVVARGYRILGQSLFCQMEDYLLLNAPGGLRLVIDGQLQEQAINGLPDVRTDGNGGLMDVAVHPRFAENGLIYLTYTKHFRTDGDLQLCSWKIRRQLSN
ncbi:MAG: hypothetical protein Ct9H300mP22_2490 [Gammaproteobacteria bacterium]|nr:MAG: hypothetical protein Ct9H300mP22_2490 [Gammaproteobacteria bacterium]